ncbi:casein kinase 2 regulatory subunit [Ciborinia camelliae]|nr:casein kinase 2 regulatory subunit [Ciborinia camelliae]
METAAQRRSSAISFHDGYLTDPCEGGIHISKSLDLRTMVFGPTDADGRQLPVSSPSPGPPPTLSRRASKRGKKRRAIKVEDLGTLGLPPLLPPLGSPTTQPPRRGKKRKALKVEDLELPGIKRTAVKVEDKDLESPGIKRTAVKVEDLESPDRKLTALKVEDLESLGIKRTTVKVENLESPGRKRTSSRVEQVKSFDSLVARLPQLIGPAKIKAMEAFRDVFPRITEANINETMTRLNGASLHSQPNIESGYGLLGGSSVVDSFATDSDSGDTGYPYKLAFISSRGNEYFCEIDEDYLTDRFNLTGLQTEVQYYQYALDLVTDVFDLDCDDDMRETIEKSARHLYGLVHARYIVTTRGLAKMLEKYKKADFGKCPRVMCKSHPLLPMGQSDNPNIKAVKLYCARCEDIYNPKSSRHSAIDGAYFGTSFHNILFQVYPAMIPAKSYDRYVPRIYGFKVHAPAALIRWQNGERDDMRRRLRKLEIESGFKDEDGDDVDDSEEEEDEEEELEGLETKAMENGQAEGGDVAGRV